MNKILSETNKEREKSCGCIIINKNKVLLIKQTKGHWGFPKGHIEKDWTGNLSTGSVVLTDVNTQAAAEGTQKAINTAKAKLESGEMHVFDTSTFTVTVADDKNVNAKVDADGHLTSYMADVDTDEAYTPDTEAVSDGYFHESEFRSAPYFDIQIDGITLLDTKF